MNSMLLHLEKYLQLRRQVGFKMKSAELFLRDFVGFALHKNASYITTKLAIEWAVSPPNIKQRQRSVRLGILRRFAAYVQAIEPETEVPGPKLLHVPYTRPAPHLYKLEDLQSLIQAAAKIDGDNGLKSVTYSTLFGLLAVTGMRVGEAISLRQADVDLRNGLLTLRQTKGNKTRLVPLHQSTTAVLLQYAKIRDKTCFKQISTHFFVGEMGPSLCYSTVNRWFRIISRRIGLRKQGDLGGPRLHDLRHRFAIETLVNWYKSGSDVDAHLPELATYLGHGHVADTYWYLSAAPELLRLAALRWERREGEPRI